MRPGGASCLASWIVPLLLWTFLPGTSLAGSEPKTTDECFSFVNYVANTGDPESARNSSVFRGEVSAVENDEQGRGSDEPIKLVWTFAGGESIRADNVAWNQGEFQFSAQSAGDTQEVTLTFNKSKGTDDENDDGISFLFVGTKGRIASGGAEEYKVAIPTNVQFNDHYCKAFKAQGVVAEQGRSQGEPLVVVEYLPLEFTRFKFTEGYFTTFIAFAIRGFNVGPESIDLEDLTLDYWFDGGDDILASESGSTSTALPFLSACSQPASLCEKMKVEVKEGLPGVQGAKYRFHMSFREGIGLLLPNPDRQIPKSGVIQEGHPLFEGVFSIRSEKTLGQMNVTQDYSFRNTEIDDRPLNNNTVNRKYEKNPRIPAYLNGNLAWGSPPAAGTEKVVQGTDGHQCEITENSRTRCGLRMTYCCSAEVIKPEDLPSRLVRLGTGANGTASVGDNALESQGTSQMDQLVLPLGAGAVTIIVSLGVCMCYRHRRRRRRRREAKAQALALTPEEPKAKDDTEFMSMAWSVAHEDSVVFGSDELDKMKQENETEPLLVKETKFHTVPSISGADSCLLLDMKEKAECTDWNVRECKTWTGYVHWMWEEWNTNFTQEIQVRRAATVMQSGAQPGGILTVNFQNLSSVPLNVDYKKEIEPYIGQKLGEGGFGKVYESTWRHQKVAIKVLKVDSETMQQTLEDEIKLTSRFHHQNIVKVLGACFGDKDTIALIMELVEGGNLSQRIHSKSRRKMEYMEVLQLGHDIAKALAYLHPTVIHRDLKPQNVLMDKNGHAKIADFGISKFKDPHKSYLSVTQTGGTPNYMAPELFNGTRVDERCDIFSLGCILYEAATRKVPFSDLPHDNFAPPLFQIIKTVAIDKKRPKIPEYCPHKLASLIRRCWNDNSKARPSATQVKQILEEMMKEEMQRRRAEVQKERQGSGLSGSTASFTNIRTGTGSFAPALNFLAGFPQQTSELSHLNRHQTQSTPHPGTTLPSNPSQAAANLSTLQGTLPPLDHTSAEQRGLALHGTSSERTDRDTAHMNTEELVRAGATAPRERSPTASAPRPPEEVQRVGAKVEETWDEPGRRPATCDSRDIAVSQAPGNLQLGAGYVGGVSVSLSSPIVGRRSKRKGAQKYAQWMRPVILPTTD